jgi:hypothetical protein
MRTYMLWYTGNKHGAIMDVTKVVEDCYKISPQLPRVMITTAILELMKADEILTADSEEQMLEMFENATIIHNKEELH